MKSFARLMSLPLFVVVPALILVPAARGEEPKAGGQQAKTFETVIPVKLEYLLYVPPDYGKDAAKRWPVILFLHGAGERGTEIERVKKHGPPKLVDGSGASPAKDFVVISPQCPPEGRWRPHEVMALLDGVMKDLKHADPDRVYLTGLSMGGFGTWEIAAQNPRRFAAIVPICGGGNARFARALRNTPIWAFHGDKDEAVPVSASVDMVEAVKKAGGSDVKLTRYPELAHDSWTVTYDNPELYAWMLAHKRAEDAGTAR
jgi:predicted peptidase